MDISITVLLALIQAVSGFLGTRVFGKNWSEPVRARFFVVLSAIGFALVVWQAVRVHEGSGENRKVLLGDPERPPFVSVISLPGNTHFVTTNNSDYPAYGTKIQLYDEASQGTVLRGYDYPDIAAHAGFVDDKPWVPNDDVFEHHFFASIATRTGVVSEELILRRAGNNQWMRASRVQQGMRILEQDVDSSWPRDEKGQVEWSHQKQ